MRNGCDVQTSNKLIISIHYLRSILYVFMNITRDERTYSLEGVFSASVSNLKLMLRIQKFTRYHRETIPPKILSNLSNDRTHARTINRHLSKNLLYILPEINLEPRAP